MKKVLAFCGSPYQILVVERIVAECYTDCQVDVIIADTIANSEELFERIKAHGFYAHTYYWKVKNRLAFSKLDQVKHSLCGWKKSKDLLKEYEGLDEKYDVFLYSSLSLVVNHLGKVLLHNNPNLVVGMFEDGFSTYSDYTGTIMNSTSMKDKILRGFFFHTDNLYIFNKKILEWTPQFKITEIHPNYSGYGLKRINAMFNCDQLEDDYNKTVIFFEESYAADGKNVDDVELVNRIASIVGKNNVFVKIHPRNPSNRFAKEGYETNKNISIPWEVILLNKSFEKTIFVTLASNAAMNPFFLFGKKTPVFLLFKCTKTPEALYASIIAFDEKLCGKYPEVFHIPQNYDELKNELVKVKETIL